MDFVIDIVGTCNLSCPSCPVGNMGDVDRPTGLMKLDLFRDIVKKIIDETPDPTAIHLYNWGEPFLHKELPEFIKVVKESGLACGLSTNLTTLDPNLRAVLKAEPDGILVSLSGYSQATYSLTHRKGDINMVKSNLYRLRSMLDRLKSKTRVTVFYHQYLHNMGEEMEQMRQLCSDLGFGFESAWAHLMPLEKSVLICEESVDSLNEEDRFIYELLVLKPDTASEICREYTVPCTLRENQTAINYDGTAALCCGVYEPEHFLGNFLDIPYAELQDLKHNNPMCKTCMKHGLHLSGVYGRGTTAGQRMDAAADRQLRVANLDVWTD